VQWARWQKEGGGGALWYGVVKTSDRLSDIVIKEGATLLLRFGGWGAGGGLGGGVVRLMAWPACWVLGAGLVLRS